MPKKNSVAFAASQFAASAVVPLPPFPSLLKKPEIARELRCSQRHVERLQRERRIPVIRLSERCVRYRLEAVLAALANPEVETSDAAAQLVPGDQAGKEISA
jgi:hypothetical protein